MNWVGTSVKLNRQILTLQMGHSSNLTIETVGQVEVRIKFNNLSTIFSGSAVVLRSLSSPIILGENFLKYNSLSPILGCAKLVHSPSAESLDLIANIQSTND